MLAFTQGAASLALGYVVLGFQPVPRAQYADENWVTCFLRTTCATKVVNQRLSGNKRSALIFFIGAKEICNNETAAAHVDEIVGAGSCVCCVYG